MLKPTHEPRVTENIDNIIDTVQNTRQSVRIYQKTMSFLIWNPSVNMALYQTKNLKI